MWGKNKNKCVIVVQLSYQIQKSRLWCSQSSSSTDTTSRLSVSNSSFFKRQFLDFTVRCRTVTCRCRPEAILLIRRVKWPTVWWTSIDSLRGTTADFFLPAGCWWNCQPAPSSSYTWRRRQVKNLRQTCEIKKCLLLRLSSGWPGCWRSGRPRLYRTRPPQWSTRSTEPGCKPHQHPSLPAPGRVSRPAVLCPSSVPSSFSCSSVSSPAPFCIVTPRLSSPCSSWRTWLDTASCICHAWVDTSEILSMMISAEKHFKQASFNKGMNRWVVYLEKSSLTVSLFHCLVLFCFVQLSRPNHRDTQFKLNWIKLIVWSIKSQKMVKHFTQCFPELKMTSSNVLFCPQLRDIQFTDTKEDINQLLMIN